MQADNLKTGGVIMKRLLPFLMIFLIFPAAGLLSEGQQETGDYKTPRETMVRTQIASRGINDPLVIEAMKIIPRHLFMPRTAWNQAYEDHPVPIGEGQTISQPYIVALMTEALALTKEDRALEIGTGSGYQAAVLSMIVKEVYTIEIKEVLHKRAAETFRTIGFENIFPLYGDGYYGWEEHAPYDCIMITAAVDHIPIPLFQQLKEGGRMILPLGNPYSFQELVLITKTADTYRIQKICGVLFVPMTGKALEGMEK
jgi:protein-L-isoaspartate(D-aspartate) O-methyltransferase